MIDISDLTDYSLIEDKIAEFIEEASQLPSVEGGSKTNWVGFDYKKKRPYASLGIVTQKTVGKPWYGLSKEVDGGTELRQTIIYHPFFWSIDINFYTDSYSEETGKAIRETARFYAQRLQNRALIPNIRSILDSVEISYGQVGSVVSGSSTQEEDQFIQQASVEFQFNGIAQTKITDTNFFESVTTPEITLSGE